MADIKNNQVAELLASLQKEFLDNLPSRIDAIETLVLKLSSQDQIEELYRMAHNLKGTAGTYTLHVISRICHQFEEYLKLPLPQDAAEGQQYINQLLKYIDLMRHSNHIAHENNPDYSRIDAELDKLITHTSKKKLKILLVDNSQSTIKLFNAAFSDENLELDCFTDGFSAIEKLTMNKYDLLITGDEIPTFSGRSVISAVKLGTNRNKKIKSVLITSKSISNTARDSDPDIILKRDAKLIENIQQILTTLKS